MSHLWEQENAGIRIIEDQAKIDENSIIQITMVLNAEVEKIEDIGKTADLLNTLINGPTPEQHILNLLLASCINGLIIESRGVL